ncbi:MAG TPA: TatA/E family twin arginine-targeting protein translocase [Bryobacteraceae bacterium]|nr:TatA/E family twin arginine-targeting protein translocase [Bryobacteraceae bacterium]
MGPLGMPEIMFIMVLALVLFGPKKLPEIGRTVGRAIREFQRASSELKTTFEREMQNLEQETNSIKEIAAPYTYDAYNYDYSEPGSPYEGSYGTESQETSTAVVPATASASATEGAESPVAPEGTIARGAETSAVSEPVESTQHASTEPGSHGPVSTTSEHNS